MENYTNDIPLIITAELVRAREKYEPFADHHHGFEALDKQLCDLERVEFSNNKHDINRELAQICAVCIRMMEAIK